MVNADSSLPHNVKDVPCHLPGYGISLPHKEQGWGGAWAAWDMTIDLGVQLALSELEGLTQEQVAALVKERLQERMRVFGTWANAILGD